MIVIYSGQNSPMFGQRGSVPCIGYMRSIATQGTVLHYRWPNIHCSILNLSSPFLCTISKAARASRHFETTFLCRNFIHKRKTTRKLLNKIKTCLFTHSRRIFIPPSFGLSFILPPGRAVRIEVFTVRQLFRVSYRVLEYSSCMEATDADFHRRHE